MNTEKPQGFHRSAPLYWFLIFAVLFSLQIIPRLSQDSPAGDEILNIVDGFYYWKGDVISTAEHPPLAKALQGLPLWTMGLKSSSGLNFSSASIRDAYFFSVLNKDHFKEILKWSRLVTFCFGLSLGFLLFSVARDRSIFFVLTVLTLWAFEPALLAFSGFVSDDLPLAFFLILVLWRFQKLIQRPSLCQSLVVGLFLGMAITVKFTAFILLPVFLVLEAAHWMTSSPHPALLTIAKRWGWGFAAAFTWICAVYLPGTIVMPGHPWPFALFLRGIHAISHAFGYAYYFRGVLSHETHWDYYPTAFVLKSPLTFLVLLAASLFLAAVQKIKLPTWQWLPVLTFFGAFLFFHDMGLRMILPVYPFCILMTGQAGEWMGNRQGRIWPITWIGLLLFQAMSVGLCFPAQVGYFNELISPDQRLYWLGDSNLDFGQDTQRLALAAQAHGWNHVKLAYFGSVNPKLYGMDWSYWTQKDLQGPQPGWVYAINDEMIQLGPAFLPAANAINKSWITRYKPTGMVGDTWHYFEIPGTIEKDGSPTLLSAPIFVDDPKTFFTK